MHLSVEAVMRRLAAVVPALLVCLTAGAGDLDRIRSRFVSAANCSCTDGEELCMDFIRCSEYGTAHDVQVLQLYDAVLLPDEEVQRLLGLFTPEGCFSDLDYSSRARGCWSPTVHLTRLYALMKLYSNPGCSWYRSPVLEDLAHRAIAFWNAAAPESTNWWHQEIGVPKRYAAALLMFGESLTEEELAVALPILEKARVGRTGQNRAWLAGNCLMRGLLTGDEALVRESRDALASEMKVVSGPGAEGVLSDGSFHQHGPQIQFGNYGMSYADVMSFWIRVLQGTEYGFTDEQVRIVTSLVRDGISWSVWRGIMDPSFCGRQLFFNGLRAKGYSLALAAANLAAADIPDAKEFARISGENLNPSRHRNSLYGAKYFPLSDCGVFRTRDWYASVRMHSTRTIGFEFTNGENQGGWFTSDGALLFMHDGSEYDNIFGVWDWRRIPGVTAYDDGNPMKTSRPKGKKFTNGSPHAGGAVSGGLMCTTVEIDRDGIHALKSDFFFKDVVVALGTDIRCSNPGVISFTTTLDQCHMKGPAQRPPVSHAETAENSCGYVWHGGMGYASLATPSAPAAELHVKTGAQSGRWNVVDPAYPDSLVTSDVFCCWIEHDPAGTGEYAYAVVPCCIPSKFFRKSGTLPVVLRNDSGCQAVSYRGKVMAVFHARGTYTIKGHTYHVSAPSILLDGQIRPIE